MTENSGPNVHALAVRQELDLSGIKFREVEALVVLGWTVPMVREAADIAKVQEVPLGYIARLNERGISLPVIAELIEIRKEHPELSVLALHRAWKLCMNDRVITDNDRAFFVEFLDACEELFNEAAAQLTSHVTRQPSFVFSRLIRYTATEAGGDLQAVYREILDDADALLGRIMQAGERGSGHQTLRGNPFDMDVDLVELSGEEDDK